MPNRTPPRRAGSAEHAEAVRRRWAYGVRQKCASVVRASGMRRPPFAPERYAAKCGVAAIVAAPVDGGPVRVEQRATADGRAQRTLIVVDRGLPPHTPQWNGAVALGLAETLVPPGVTGDARRALAEAAAADLLLPMPAFRPAAARTDLTMDGLRDLSARFAAPLRLTARQWLSTGFWRGFALLWREEGGGLRLRWRAASSGRFPPALALGADAAAVWAPASRLFATHRTGRAHHGVEEVRTGTETAWWFTRFAGVRDPVFAGRYGPGPADDARAPAPAVFAMVLLASGGPMRAPRATRAGQRRPPEGILSGP
ncbi:MAG TPA: hypothetical protein VGX97_08505 [bacterium]|nr:hypothetical protein [bacterium]